MANLNEATSYELILDEGTTINAKFSKQVSSVTYSPTINCIIALIDDQIQVIDASAGCLLQSTNPIHTTKTTKADLNTDATLQTQSQVLHCTLHPTVDKLVIVGDRQVGAREDINGAYLLQTFLDPPLTEDDDEVWLDLDLPKARTVLSGLKQLATLRKDFMSEIISLLCEQLQQEIDKFPENQEQSLKTSKWQVCIFKGQLSVLKNLFEQGLGHLMVDANYKHSQIVPVFSAIRYRLSSLSSSNKEFSIDPTHYDAKWRSLMYVEALRLETFALWPHKNYKWANPEAMAGAGFYFEPTGSDRTLCFQCGICLLYWEPTDEPWSEHERHSNNCAYVMGKFTDNVPKIVSESSSPARQHYSTEKISCWPEVYHTSCWASGSKDGVVTVWDLKIGMQEVKLLQTGQYDVNKLDKYETFLASENNYGTKVIEVNSLVHPPASEPGTASSSTISSQSTTKQSIGSSTAGDEKSQDEKVADDSETVTVKSGPLENGAKIETKITEVEEVASSESSAPLKNTKSLDNSTSSQPNLVEFAGELTSICLAALGDSTKLPKKEPEDKQATPIKDHKEINPEDDFPTYLISAMSGVKQEKNRILIQIHQVLKPIGVDNSIVSNTNVNNQSGTIQDIFLDSDSDEGINDYFMLTPQSTSNADVTNNTGELDDMSIESVNLNVTTDKESTSVVPLTPAHIQSLVIDILPEFINPKVNQIVILNNGKSVGFLLSWECQDETKATGGLLEYHISYASNTCMIDGVLDFQIFPDRASTISNLTVLYFAKLVTETEEQSGENKEPPKEAQAAAESSESSEDDMYIHALFEESDSAALDFMRMKNQRVTKGNIAACIDNNGDLCLISIYQLKTLCQVSKESVDNPFTHLTYCKGLERLAIVCKDGSIKVFIPRGPLFNLISDTAKQDINLSQSQIITQEFFSSPLTLQKLRSLVTSYQGNILENQPFMTTPPGWRETKPEQQNRRNPLHVHQQSKREQSRLCWQYKPTSDGQKDASNKPHLFELNLPQACSLSHIEVKFYLHSHIDLPADLMISLLVPVSAKEASETNNSRSEASNDALVISGLKLSTLSGPIKLQHCLDASGVSGLVYLASPQLLNVKNRILYLLIHDVTQGETLDNSDQALIDSKEKLEEAKEKEPKEAKEIKDDKDTKTKDNKDSKESKDNKDKKKEKELPIETVYITIYQISSTVSATQLLTLRTYVRDSKLQSTLLSIASRAPTEDEVQLELADMDEMQLLALDLCSWIAGMQAHDSVTLANFPKVVSHHLEPLLNACILYGNRASSHKCIRLLSILLKSEDTSDEPTSYQTNFTANLVSAILSIIPKCATDICYSVSVRWFFKLLSYLSNSYSAENFTIPLVSLLNTCLEKSNSHHESLHAILCSKFELYGSPLDSYICEAPLPSLKYIPPPPKPPGSTSTTAPQVTYILDINSVKGATSYEHDDLSKMLQNSSSTASTSSASSTSPASSSTSGTYAIAAKKFFVPVSAVSEYLSYPAMGLLDSQSLLLKVSTLNHCSCYPADKDKISSIAGKVATSSDIQIGQEIDPIHFSGFDQTKTDYIDFLIEHLTTILLDDPESKSVHMVDSLNDEGPTDIAKKKPGPLFARLNQSKSDLPEIYTSVQELHMWLMEQPKQYILQVDSVQSGAVYSAVFQLSYEIELSDFFIPPSEHMSSVAVDVWVNPDNSIRLGSTNDFTTKAFVLSNITPPPLCSFIKVSFGGKLGASGSLAKVNIGLFYGKPRLPSHCSKYALPIQLEVLKLTRSEYQSYRSKLVILLQTVQHIDDGNMPKDIKTQIEQVYSDCCWHRLQINRLRRLIENTCASSNISLKPSDPSESLFATTPTTPIKHPLFVPLPNSYLHLVIESIIDTLLASCFTSHTKGLDLNNTPFVGQDTLADDEDDEKDVDVDFTLAPEEQISSLTLDRSICESLFYKICLVARPEILVKCSSLLLATASHSQWWPEFIANLLKNLFSMGIPRVVVKDRVFLIVSYMAEMSPNASQIIECLSKILAELLPVMSEIEEDEMGFCLPVIADVQLLSWGLLLMLRLLEKYYSQPNSIKNKDSTSTSAASQASIGSKTSKWDFILPSTNLENPSTSKSTQSTSKPQGQQSPEEDLVKSEEEKKERRKISRIVSMHKQRVEDLRVQYQSLYTDYQQQKESRDDSCESQIAAQEIYNRLRKIKSSAKKHYKDAMTLRFQRTCLLVRKFERKLASVKAKLPVSEQGETDIDQVSIIPNSVCSPLAKSLVRLLLSMDSTFHLDLYLIACKILSKISLISVPPLALHELFTQEQLIHLLTRALTNTEYIAPVTPIPTKGPEWSSHALRCLFINVLYSEFVSGPKKFKGTQAKLTLEASKRSPTHLHPTTDSSTTTTDTTTTNTTATTSATTAVTTTATTDTSTTTTMPTKTTSMSTSNNSDATSITSTTVKDVSTVTNTLIKSALDEIEGENSATSLTLQEQESHDVAALHAAKQQHAQVISKLTRRLKKIKSKAEKLGVKIEVPEEFEPIILLGSSKNQSIQLNEQYSKVIDDRLSNTFEYFAETQLQLLAKEEAELVVYALNEGAQPQPTSQTLIYPITKKTSGEMKESINNSGALIYKTFSQLILECSNHPFNNFSLELFLELWVDMLDAISYNSNKDGNESVNYIAETLHLNELIIQLLRYISESDVISSRAWQLLFKISYYSFIMQLDINEEGMMLVTTVYLNFLTGKTAAPIEGHHEELINDPTGTFSLVLETFYNIDQNHKPSKQAKLWQAIMLNVLFKLFESRDLLTRLAQGEALTLMIKSLQADLKHPFNNPYVSTDRLSDFAHSAVKYIANTINLSCPVYCRSDAINNSYWIKKVNKIKFFPDTFSPIRLCCALISFIHRLVTLYTNAYTSSDESQTPKTKVANEPVEVNLEEFFNLQLQNNDVESHGDSDKIISTSGDTTLEASNETDLDKKASQLKQEEWKKEALVTTVDKYMHEKFHMANIVLKNENTINLLIQILNKFGELPEVYKLSNKEKKEKPTAFTTETECTVFFLHMKIKQFMNALVKHTSQDSMERLYTPLANFLKETACQKVHMPFLSDSLLEFSSSLISSKACAQGFLKLGSLTPLMTGLMRSSKLCLNHSKGPLSDTITTLGGGPTQTRIEDTSGLLNFSGKAFILMNDANGLLCTGMLQNLLSQRMARSRTAAWNCQFRDYPKAWITIYIYLPHPILLHAVQINIHNTSFQFCPSYIAIDVARNLGCEPDIPVATPIRTSGLGTIRIELTHPEVVQALNIHLCKPRDFQSISLSTINILGTSLYTDISEIVTYDKPITDIYPPHASYPWIQLLCKLLITHSDLAPDIVRTSMQSAHMLNTLVSFLTAPVSLSGLQQIEAILLTLAEHSNEIALQLMRLLLHPSYFKQTSPPHYLDATKGQPLSTITTSFMHLLYYLAVATNEASTDRLKFFILHTKPLLLSFDKHSECLPEMLHVLSTAIWSSKKVGMVNFISDIITKSEFNQLTSVALSPHISLGMKKALDLFLCAICFAFPPYYSLMLLKSEETFLGLNVNTNSNNFASLLSTLSIVSQSTTSTQALLESAIPLNFCHRLQILFEYLLVDNYVLLEKENISLDDAPLILQFFSQIADDQMLMKEWIGSEEPRKFWLPLLEFLCLPVPSGENLNIAVFKSCQSAALNFFLSVSRHHLKNQKIVVEMLCDALKKAIVSIREGTHSHQKGSMLPPFVQSLVLHFILESEIMKIFLTPRKSFKLGENKNFISLGKFMSSLSYYTGSGLVKVSECSLEHPRFGCGHGRYLLYARSSTSIDTLSNALKAVQQYAPPGSPLSLNPQPIQVKSATTDYQVLDDKIANLLTNYYEQSDDSLLSNIINNSGVCQIPQNADANKSTDTTQLSNKTNSIVFYKTDSSKSSPLNSKSLLLKIEKTLKSKSSYDSNSYLQLFYDFGESDKKVQESNETVIPSQMELFASCGGLTLLAEYLPLIYPNFWPRTENLFESNKVEKPVYPEDISGPLTSAESTICKLLPLNSIIVLGLSLKIEETSEPLLSHPITAKCMLRLLFGAEDDGNGKSISSLSENITKLLPLLPYILLRQVLNKTLDSTPEGQNLRDRTYQVGLFHHILHCVATMGHHDSKDNKQDLVGSTKISQNKIGQKGMGEGEGSKLYWEKGTGFGTGSTTSKFDLDQLMNKQKVEEKHITLCFDILSLFLGENPSSHESTSSNGYKVPQTLYNLLNYSCLVPALESYLRNDSVLDMSRHVPLYVSIMNFIKRFVNCSVFIPLMLPSSPDSANCLHKHLNSMNTVIKTYLKQVAKSDIPPTAPLDTKSPAPSQIVHSLLSAVTPPSLVLYNYPDILSTLMNEKTPQTSTKNDEPADLESLNYFLEEVQRTCTLANERVKTYQTEEQSIGKVLSKSLATDYMSQMSSLQFDTHQLVKDNKGSLTYTHAFYWSSRVQMNITNPKRARRLAQEISSLATSLPLSQSSSVFVRVDEERLDIMKVLITGPDETPYANGCFVFDVYFPSEYPSSPMLVQLETTGQRTIRFNPNLYNDGKVCLSILNTWHGRPEERWSPQNSSFLQVLVSVQSLILVPEPYFNEPGYEQSRGTTGGNQRNQDYNSNICQATARWAILEQIRNPPLCFKKVILRHFALKKDQVYEACESWVQDMKSWIKSRSLSTTSNIAQHLKSLQTHLKQIKTELDKLDPKDYADTDSEDDKTLESEPETLKTET